MAERDGTTTTESPSLVSDETLRLYLLCRLGENERGRIDERLMVDDQLAERVLLAESELVDDYAARRLSSTEQELFDKKFLVTDERRQKLSLASALHGFASSQSNEPSIPTRVSPARSWSEWLGGFFGFEPRPAWAFAATFAALVLIGGAAWFLIRQSGESNSVITRNEPIPSVSPGQVAPSPPPTSTSPGPGSTVTPNTRPSPAEPVIQPAVASFVLLPGALRGGGETTRVSVPRGERDIVRLSLVLETPAEGTYQAELETAEGQKVLVRSNIRATRNGQTKVVLNISARLLHSRDYQIKLNRQKPDGQTESVGRYYFRALEE